MKIDEIELEVIKDYFKGLKRYRGVYYVTLRALVSRRLRQVKVKCGNGAKNPMPYSMIADIVYSDKTKTAETQRNCKSVYLDKTITDKLGDWKRWVLSGEYPITDQSWECEYIMVNNEVRTYKRSICNLMALTAKEAELVLGETSYRRSELARKKINRKNISSKATKVE